MGDPGGITKGDPDNWTLRTVAVHRGEQISERALLAMFSPIITNDRAGGSRKREGDKISGRGEKP